MPDLTPPPEQPLPRLAKERIRTQLLSPAPRRSWLVPVVAAAAVVGVVAVGTALTRGGGEDPETVAPAGTTSASETDAAQPTPPATPSVASDPACDREVRLKGATVTASLGTTYLYENDNAWVVCDTFASEDGGVPTLLETYQQGAAYEPDQATTAISMNFLMGGGTQYFAAGKRFPGVDDISYKFPDGKVVHAEFQGDFWVMDYQPTTGPLVSPNLNGLAPIEVSVEGPNTGQGWTLNWGEDTCAQRNHGC